MQKPSELKPWMKYWDGDEAIPDVSEFDCGVYEYIRKKNMDNLNASALRYFDRKITFAELFENIENAAKAFRKSGIGKGDIVTVCSVMMPETIYIFYALDMLGAMINLVDPRTSAKGLHGYVEEVHSKVSVTLSAVCDKMTEAVKGTENKTLIVISPADSLTGAKKALFKLSGKDKYSKGENVIAWKDFIDAAKNEPAVAPVTCEEDRAILMVHTGGTTGKPKCVMLGDRALNALARQAGFMRLKRGQRFLNIMPPFIAYGYGMGTHAPLSAGMEVIVIPQFDAKEFGKLLLKYRPEHTAGVPLHYQMLARDPKLKNADLSFIVSTGAGGDAITVQAEDEVNEFLRAHNAPFDINKGYGMTEISSGISVSFGKVNKRGSAGIPMCLTTVGIFEPNTDHELGFGEEGEICATSPCIMEGYYEMPEETEMVLQKHGDGKVWVHTGDIGKMDEDGFLYIINRIKRVIIRHDGFKVYPYLIEDVISRLEGVKNCCAVAIKDRNHRQGDLPFVFVEAEKGASGAGLEPRIRKTCDTELAEYVIPVGYAFIEALPYTGIGKVDYLKLQKDAEGIEY